jgi:DNA-binding transcriptional ArsR family regulator
MMGARNSILSNIWNPFGLRGDPFFQEELRVDPHSAFPAELLFVGRQEELRRVGRRIGGAELSRTIVEGPAGVGKTSFVNRLKAEFAHTGSFAVHEQPIRLTSRSTPDSFLADVLRVLVRLFNSGGARRDEFWDRVAFLVESRTLTSGGITLAGSGAAFHQQRTAAEVSHEPLIEVVSEALARMGEAYGTAVVLHVNNLENLALVATEAARLLIQNIRDVFLQTGAHWLMVGATGVEAAVFRKSDQVGGIFPAALRLEALAPSDIARLLSLRYEHLRAEKVPLVPPVAPEVAARLYGRYRGDLRNFLRLLSDAANLILGVEGVTPMTEEHILQAAGREYRERILQEIGEQDFRYLRTIAERSEASGFRVTDVAHWLNVSQAGGSGIVARLEAAGLIREERREGKSVYYQPTGMTSVALAAEPNSAAPVRQR